jgi:hypothetical protein
MVEELRPGFLDPSALDPAAQTQAADDMTQEVNASFADLDQRQEEVGARDGDRNSGKARAAAQIYDSDPRRQGISRRQAVLNMTQESRGFGRADQVRPRSPAYQLGQEAIDRLWPCLRHDISQEGS